MIRFALAAVMAVPVAVACGVAAGQTIPSTLQLDLPRIDGAAAPQAAAARPSSRPAAVAAPAPRRDLSTVIHDGAPYDAAGQIAALQAAVRELQEIRASGGFTPVPGAAPCGWAIGASA